MSRIDPEIKATVVARLQHQRAAGASITADVRRTARDLSIGERTLWRWLDAEGAPGPRQPRGDRYELTEEDRNAYVEQRGNVTAVYRVLHAESADGPSLRRLQTAFRELTPAERAAAVDGSAGRRRHEVFLRWESNRRNALWEADHVELPVWVLAPRAQRARKPWATLFLDAYSRLIMGWALSLHPHAGVVLAALRAGIVVDEDRGPFGGLPEALRPDNGLEFMATALRRCTAALGIELEPTPAYMPHRKGKVERVNRTLDQEFLSGLPFYVDGPRGADGRLLGPDAEPMSLELFTDRFATWVHEYNTTREHSALGENPLARWQRDATPLHEVPARELHWMLLADAERTINKDGIHFGGVRFLAAELNGRVGQRVQVRYSPHDLRQIEVFLADEWLVTAYPQETLTAEQRAAVLDRRRADAAELARRRQTPRQPRRSRAAGPDHRVRAGTRDHGHPHRGARSGSAEARGDGSAAAGAYGRARLASRFRLLEPHRSGRRPRAR